MLGQDGGWGSSTHEDGAAMCKIRWGIEQNHFGDLAAAGVWMLVAVWVRFQVGGTGSSGTGMGGKW